MTALRFVPHALKVNATKANETASDLDKNTAMIISKDANALPLIRTFVGFEPCLVQESPYALQSQANFGSAPKEAVFYPLETE